MLSIRETVRQLQLPASWLLTERLELYAVGSTPNAELMHELRSCDGMIAVRGIGDCNGAGIVGKAIREGFEAANGIHEERLFVFKSLSLRGRRRGTEKKEGFAVNQDAKRLVLYDALLSSGDLHHLVETAAEILGNPIAICDMGLGTIAISASLSDDPEWGAPNAGMDAPDVRQATLKGDFRKVYASDKTVLGDYHGAKQRYLAARIRRKNHVIGHAVVLERNHAFTAEDQEILPDICRTIGFALAPEADIDQLSERHGRLFLDILEGRLQDADAIEARMRSAKLAIPANMALLLFRPASETGQVPARHLLERLKRVFPGGFGVIYGGDVVFVVDNAIETLERDIASAVPLGLTSVGMSYPFSSFVSLKNAFEQAEASVRLSGYKESASGLIRYQDVVAMHLSECASAMRETSVFEHPAIGLLHEAGMQDNVDYVRDLETYLFCGRNASAAAKALHVHRNTMYYRLQRIQDIAGVDLLDAAMCFALQLSIAMCGKHGD